MKQFSKHFGVAIVALGVCAFAGALFAQSLFWFLDFLRSLGLEVWMVQAISLSVIVVIASAITAFFRTGEKP